MPRIRRAVSTPAVRLRAQGRAVLRTLTMNGRSTGSASRFLFSLFQLYACRYGLSVAHHLDFDDIADFAAA